MKFAKIVSGEGAGAGRVTLVTAGLAAVLLLAAGSPRAAELQQDAPAVERGAPVTPYMFFGDLREVPQAPQWQPGDPVTEIPRRFYPKPGYPEYRDYEVGRDPLLDRQQQAETLGGDVFTVPSRSFAGQGYSGVNPPDTVGDVGPDHYIQSINAGGGAVVRIYDKALPTPSVLTTFTMDTLGSGACAGGLGDPVVLYDRHAGRWMLSEFSSGGNNLCIYISQTGDPVTGGWYGYQFTAPSFPDYPKYGVWPTDVNGGSGSYVGTANDGGPGIYAFDRGAMLLGEAATFLRVTIPNLPGFGFEAPTPADLDGPTPPPAGAPAIIMRHRDTENHGGPDAPGDLLEIWTFQVDWVDTNNSVLTQQPSIDVAEFDSSLCGLSSFNCFPQPNTGTTLDPLREVIMFRLQYINHENDFETLVGNLVTDVDGTNHGGIRWFELRGGTPGWTLHQEGTYSIDADHRWMGAISMDQSGNIALAYNVSSNTTFPSLRYTGRKFDDPLGMMTQPESVIHAGTSQNSSNRYGDYASMNLDPSDDCTFWFTGEDNTATSWRTQIASFRFDACGCLLEPLPPTVETDLPVENQIDIFWNDSELDVVTEYLLQRARVPGGPYETIATVPDSSPGAADGQDYFYSDTDVAGGVTYYYVVIATDGGPCKSDAVNEASATGYGICPLQPVFEGLQSVVSATSDTCSAVLSWNPATADCGGPALYNVYRSTSPGFTPDPSNLLVAGHPSTTLFDINDLQEGEFYHYIVRALDAGNGVEELNTTELTVQSAGPFTGLNTVLFEDFEGAGSFGAWTVGTGPGNHTCGEWERVNPATQRPDGGSGFYALSESETCAPLLPQTSTYMDSPAIDLAIPGIQGVTLEVDLYYNHRTGDDATIEVFDGSQWVVIWADSNADVDQHLVFDVTAQAAGNAAFRVRFNYQNANNDYWYAVDNVEVIADVLNPCFTGAAPAPAASGAGPGTPLHGDRVSASGDTIAVSWGASCGAVDYNLLYGDLAGVAGYALDGSTCSLGTSGSFNWTTVPATSLYFLVVGTDASGGTESSWGQSAFGERNGLSPSGHCSVSAKSITATCN